MAVDVLMPKLGLTMTEGVVDQWYVSAGEQVTKGQVLATISSEKLSQDVVAEQDGVLAKIVTEAGDVALVKTPIAVIAEPGEQVDADDPAPEAAPEESAPADTPAAPQAEPPAAAPRRAGDKVRISPLAKKIAQKAGVDYSQIVGTGGNGRITRRDVELFIEQHAQAPATAPAEAEAAPQTPAEVPPVAAAPVVAGGGLTGMRKAIATNMMHSLHTTAQLTLHRRVNINALLEFRKEMKSRATGVEPGAFSINVLLLKAVALALAEHPQLNARYDGQSLQEFDQVNVGVAVSLDAGLVVPTVANVGSKSLSELHREFTDKVERARGGDFDTSAPGTFTITNLGTQGIDYFTPIINAPEVAILGVGATQQSLALDGEGHLVTNNELPLSLTIDHQIVDGAPGAAFLQTLADILANPFRIVV